MVIPRFVQKALYNEPITIHGTGEQTRCFTHVFDSVRALQKLMNTDGLEGEIFNVGNHDEISINELAERVIELTGSSSRIEHISYEEAYGKGFEDMERRTPDLSKVKQAIGYEPTYSIDEILENVIQHACQSRKAANE